MNDPIGKSKWDKIEDTYAEAFKGICCRVIITADDDETLRRAAYDATSTPGQLLEELKVGSKGGWVKIILLMVEKVPYCNSGTIKKTRKNSKLNYPIVYDRTS